MNRIHAITLRIPVNAGVDIAYITDALGECARSLETEQAEGRKIGLIPDVDDVGRFAWSIVAESYPGIGEDS